MQPNWYGVCEKNSSQAASAAAKAGALTAAAARKSSCTSDDIFPSCDGAILKLGRFHWSLGFAASAVSAFQAARESM
jgi:hypothetical protein